MKEDPLVPDPLARVFETQAGVCAAFGSAFYGALCRRIAANLDWSVRALFAPWRGRSFEALMEAAVSLRFLGAVHDLALSGEDPALAATFPPAAADADVAWRAARAAIETRGDRLAAFMAHEPQTNEVRRAACLLPGFLQIAAETRHGLACFELGASAGLNQLWRRFHYDYGPAGSWGNPTALVRLTTDWTGAPPLLRVKNPRLSTTSACDRNPIDIRDPLQRRRLRAYLWPDQTERLERFDAAVSMALAKGMRVEAADAVAWAKRHCTPKPGLTTVIYHSIFWQYLPSEKQEALAAVIADHGALASDDAPLAWLRMEPAPGQIVPIELRLTLWPGGQERRLATVQAHGAWVRWDPEDVSALQTGAGGA